MKGDDIHSGIRVILEMFHSSMTALTDFPKGALPHNHIIVMPLNHVKQMEYKLRHSALV